MNPFRMLGVSVAPWINSGYGIQAGTWFPRFNRLGYPVMLYAYRGLIGKSVFWPDNSGIQVQPQGRMSQFGLEMVPHYYHLHEADCVLSLCNLFLFGEIQRQIASSSMPWFHWTPVDSDPLGAPDHNLLNITGITPIAMSRFGERVLRDAGFNPLYAPHSVDCTVFRPPPSTSARQAARQALGIPDDMFVLIMNGANEASADRKAFWQQLSAFAAFHSRHPKSLFYIHAIANRHPIGLDLSSMVRRLSIEDSVVFCDDALYNSGGYTSDMLREQFYWIGDIATQASKAEGFGIPIIEAQACGVPVVVTNFGPMTELSAPGISGGYRVPGQSEWSTLDSSGWLCPSISDLEDAYELFYREWRNDTISSLSQAARAHAIQWDTRRIQEEFWLPTLHRMGDMIGSSGTPLPKSSLYSQHTFPNSTGGSVAAGPPEAASSPGEGASAASGTSETSEASGPSLPDSPAVV